MERSQILWLLGDHKLFEDKECSTTNECQRKIAGICTLYRDIRWSYSISLWFQHKNTNQWNIIINPKYIEWKEVFPIWWDRRLEGETYFTGKLRTGWKAREALKGTSSDSVQFLCSARKVLVFIVYICLSRFWGITSIHFYHFVELYCS